MNRIVPALKNQPEPRHRQAVRPGDQPGGLPANSEDRGGGLFFFTVSAAVGLSDGVAHVAKLLATEVPVAPNF